jgi:hypothetical protein
MHRHATNIHGHASGWHVHIVGLPISTYSRDIVRRIATNAKLRSVHITNVHRSVRDQARIFYQKHVIEQKTAHYKNQEVSHIIAHARSLHAKGFSDHTVQTYLMRAIEQAHGGPGSISRHLLGSPLVEVFDVAHYSGPTNGPGRHNYMTTAEAHAFLDACREFVPFPINRLGRSVELGLKLPHYEFVDETCFHLEVLQPFDALEVKSSTMYA